MLAIDERVADRPDLQGASFRWFAGTAPELAVTIDLEAALPRLSATVRKMLRTIPCGSRASINAGNWS